MNVNHELMELKQATQLTGALHELQIHQLKLWPLLLFPVPKNNTQFAFDFENQEITFTVKANVPLKDWKKNTAMLAMWTQQLLGTQYTVKVKSKTDGKVFVVRAQGKKESIFSEAVKRMTKKGKK